MTEQEGRQKLVDLMEDMPIAMMTTFGADGPRSVPMARQEVEPGAELWFITARDTEHVRAMATEPRVALTFSSRDAWVAIDGPGPGRRRPGQAGEQLWNTFAEAWLPGGPEDPDAVLLHVEVEAAEYWDTPGSKVASLVSFVKTKLTGATYDADHGTVR